MNCPSFTVRRRSPLPFVRRVVLSLAILSVFLGVNAVAQQRLLERSYDKAGATRLEVESVFSSGGTRGFMPVRVTIRNGTAENRDWRLSFNFGSGWAEMTYRSEFVVSVDSGAEVMQDLLVPIPTTLNGSGGYRQVSVRATSAGLPSANQSDGTQSFLAWPGLAISKSLADRNITRLNSEANSRGSSTTDSFAVSFDPEMLPADWRGYTSLDGLLITEEEWDKLNPGTRLAILEWVRLGGRLDFYTKKPEPKTWLADRPFLKEITEGLKDNRVNRGMGRIFAWNWDGQNLDPKPVVTRYASVPNLAETLVSDYSRDWPLQRSFGSKSFNVVLVVLLLIAFGIVVGPINLFVLAKPGRRHRLFVTTPIISLIASLLILAIILLGDGIGGSGRRAVLALLEPGAEEKRLYLTQEQISRSGVLLGSAFEVNEPVFVSPVMLPPSPWNRLDRSSNPVASFTLEGKTYRGDWFQSRSEQGQFLQSVRPTRSRIELQTSATGEEPPQVVSSLEFSVDEFFYRDQGGKVWKSAAPGPFVGGEAIPLEASDAEALEKWWEEKSQDFSSPLRSKSRALWKEQGRFFATSADQESGFIPTLKSIRWKEESALISGAVLESGGSSDTPPATEVQEQ